jgi:hypothetical protein
MTKSKQIELIPTVASGVPVDKSVNKADLQLAIDHFHAAYLTSYGEPPTWGAKRAAMMKRLISAHGLVRVRRTIDRLFGNPPAWLRPRFDLETLTQHFDKLGDESRAGMTPDQIRAWGRGE